MLCMYGGKGMNYVQIRLLHILRVVIFTVFVLHIGLDNYAMTSVVLPTSLVMISDFAFHSCRALLAAIIPTYHIEVPLKWLDYLLSLCPCLISLRSVTFLGQKAFFCKYPDLMEWWLYGFLSLKVLGFRIYMIPSCSVCMGMKVEVWFLVRGWSYK